MRQEDYVNDAIELLRQLIATPSISRDEKAAADIIQKRMTACGLAHGVRETTFGYCRPTGTTASPPCCSTRTSTR